MIRCPRDLLPGEVHDLETRGAQPGVPFELGHRAGRVGVLDRAVRLPDGPVSAPEEVGAADHLVLISDPGLQVRPWQAEIVEYGSRDGFQDRLRPGIGKRRNLSGVLDTRPARTLRNA